MFLYLSKKISLPNGQPLHSLAWHGEQGYLAAGGSKGFLKVLKFDSGTSFAASRNAIPGNSTSVSMNQSLEKHVAKVHLAVWNRAEIKLTTADESGVIVVWVLHAGQWQHELVNNRYNVAVQQIDWSRSGQRIAILYRDGTLLVGSKDGSRLWSKELKHVVMTHVRWSPDGKLLAFATQSGQIHLHDQLGNFMTGLVLPEDSRFQPSAVVAMDWGQKASQQSDKPSLAVAFSTGYVVMYRDEKDTDPLFFDSGFQSDFHMEWSPDGTMLALAGQSKSGTIQLDGSRPVLASFFDPWGKPIRSLRLPGQRLGGLSWGDRGLRIAFAIDSAIFIATLQPCYKWAYLTTDGQDLPSVSGNVRSAIRHNGILVYSFLVAEKNEWYVRFWNSRTLESFTKSFRHVHHVTAYADRCVVVGQSLETAGQLTLQLCNSMGTVLESRQLEEEPEQVLVNSMFIVYRCRQGSLLYIWQYRSAFDKQLAGNSGIVRLAETLLGERQLMSLEGWLHVDELIKASQDGVRLISDYLDTKELRPSGDPITSMALSNTNLLIARQTGVLAQFSIPSLSLLKTYSELSAAPEAPTAVTLTRLFINCDNSKVLVVDLMGTAWLLKLQNPFQSDKRSETSVDNDPSNCLLEFNRKDVWDACWAKDSPDHFALMEKTRMYIFRLLDPEEPVESSGYLSAELTSQTLRIYETKSLRDTRKILDQVSLADAFRFVEENPHDCLWHLLGEAALERMEFQSALDAYVKRQDYHSVRFVKRVQQMEDRRIQEAEIHAFFGRFDAAESQFLAIGRTALAIQLRMKIGDWFRVQELVKNDSNGYVDDLLADRIANSLGEYYYERKLYSEAVKYFESAKNFDRLAECYYVLEKFDQLYQLVQALPDHLSQLINTIAEWLLSVGMCHEAADAFVRSGNFHGAVHSCVYLNQWERAVSLAKQYRILDMDRLLANHVNQLHDKKDWLGLIELHHLAGTPLKSAQYLFTVADSMVNKSRKTRNGLGEPPVMMKKIYVMAAVEASRHLRQREEEMQSKEQADRLLAQDEFGLAVGNRFASNVWRGAEAYHFYALAQRNLAKGDTVGAHHVAARLLSYLDILDPLRVHSLLALTALVTQHWYTASNALSWLIRHENQMMDDPMARIYEQQEDAPLVGLARSVFGQQVSEDPLSRIPCPHCHSQMDERATTCTVCLSKFDVCTASGVTIFDQRNSVPCGQCRHRILAQFAEGFLHCPLCHSPLNANVS